VFCTPVFRLTVRNENGSRALGRHGTIAARGLYFVRAEQGGTVVTKKLVRA